MTEKAKIKFYNINKCGYYSNQNDDRFSSIGETLKDLKDWAFDGIKHLSETCTNESVNQNTLNTYCFDMESNEYNDYLFITWNETETLDGSFASADGRDVAGNVKIKKMMSFLDIYQATQLFFGLSLQKICLQL